jgi:hypothetical protein
MYRSRGIIMSVRPKTLRYYGNVAKMDETRNTYRNLLGLSSWETWAVKTEMEKECMCNVKMDVKGGWDLNRAG